MKRVSYSDTSSMYCFMTQKHSTHDEQWLLPGTTSSYFCFACAIETLEDSSSLELHKKKIITEMLEIFLSNNTIWKMLCSKREVFVHVLELFVNLLYVSKDPDYASAVTECCLLTVKQTSTEQAALVVVDSVITKEHFMKNLHLLTLLVKLTNFSLSCLQPLCEEPGRYLKIIVKESSVSSNECLFPIWQLINKVLSWSENLPKVLLQEVLISTSKMMHSSSLVAVQIEMLETLKRFAELKHLQQLLLDYESSKFTNPTQSVFESLKKFLLSSNEQVQCATICAISAIALSCNFQNQTLVTLVDVLLDKGVSEYLIELLASADENAMKLIFQCLQKLSQSKAFTKMGFMIYGLNSIVNALEKSLSFHDISSLCHGISFLTTMLRKEIIGRPGSQSSKEYVDLVRILSQSFQKSESSIKHAVVICLQQILLRAEGISNLYKSILDLIESVFNYIDKHWGNSSLADQSSVDFLCAVYEAILRFADHVKVHSANDQNNNVTSTQTLSRSDSSQPKPQMSLDEAARCLFYLCDTLFIPQALKFLPNKIVKFQCSFFKMLLCILELSSTMGEKLALKLAESSFICTIFEFKVVASRTMENMDEIMAKLLHYLCLSLDAGINDEMKNQLYSCFLSFSIPVNDWKCFLDQHSSNMKSVSKAFVQNARVCILALLSYGCISGSPIISPAILHQEISKFSFSEDFPCLPVLGKRYFLYLWCKLEQCLAQSVAQCQPCQNVVKCMNTTTDGDLLYMINEALLTWVLTVNFPMKDEIVTKYLEKVNCVDDDADKELLKLLSTLNSKALVVQFIETMFGVISVCENSVVLKNITILLEKLLPYLEQQSFDHLKTVTHKILLSCMNSMTSKSLVCLLHCLVAIEKSCSLIVNDEDLKLLYRVLSLFAESAYMQLEVLNFVYIMLVKCMRYQYVRPLTVISEKMTSFMSFEKSFFLNENAIKNSLASAELEQINSAFLLTISELMLASQLFSQSYPFSFKIRKELLMQLLVSSSLPLLQNSVLTFWSRYFHLNCSSSLVSLVHNNGERSQIIMQDIKLIYIALQNVYYNQEVLIRSAVVSCISSLLSNVTEKNILLNQPWNQIIQDVALERLSFVDYDPAAVRLLAVFLKHTGKIADGLLDNLLILLKESHKTEPNLSTIQDLIMLYETVFSTQAASNITYVQLKQIKDELKNTESHVNKCQVDLNANCVTFVSLNGVMFAEDYLQKSYNVFDLIRKVKRVVDKKMDIIDGDATDSGEETEE